MKTRLLLAAWVFMVSACSLTSIEWDSQFYIVKPQDTLYSIAWRYNLHYKQVAVWNEIKPPFTIYPGQRLVLSESAYRKSKTTQTVSRQNENRRVESTRLNATPPKHESVGKWRWPVQGKIKKKFTGRKSGSQGIDIGGNVGQDIKAAANGKVVYSGEGLIGYGKLVIIKHNETYLSAYAHNSRLMVKEDEQVRIGQKIAEMGSANGSNGQSGQLHFEIRKLGKPVDPMKYLPKS